MSHAILFESANLVVVDERQDKKPFKEMQNGGAYLRADWLWVASQSGMKRTAERLSKLATNFRVHVIMHESRDHRPAERTYIPDTRPDAVNVVLWNNINKPDVHIPLTPWMTVHRVFHCLHAGSGKDLQQNLLECLSKFVNHFGMPGGSMYNFGWEISSQMRYFLSAAMTCRSAREQIMSNDLDYTAELFAQHHFGGIKLLRTKDWLKRMPDLFKAGKINKMLENPEETDKMLAELENQLTADMNTLSTAMLGKQLKF